MLIDERLKIINHHLERLAIFLKGYVFSSWLQELRKDSELLRDIEDAVKDVDHFRKKHWDNPLEFGLYRTVVYCLVRELKPKVFVETGVLHGLTSNYALRAIKSNGVGKLISIDLPSYFESGPSNHDGYEDVLPSGKEPGWVINEKYKTWWELHLGRSLDLLPSLLEHHDEIDLFLHDSEHTYDTMWGEFKTVWPHLKKGGLLIADNIGDNTAFFDFAMSVSRCPLVIPDGDRMINGPIRFGIIQK